MKNQNDILIVIPAFNESGNIARTVAEAVSCGVAADLLVIDDGSSDTTLAEARKTPAMIISLPFNLGVGGAVQTGFQFALRHGYAMAVQVDGDGQHDLRYLKDILAPIRSGDCDVAIGSRFIGDDLGYRSSFIRRIGIHFFARLISGLTGYPVTDPTSGFRAYHQKALKVFAQNYPIDFPEPESIVLARNHGLRLREVPVQMRKRVHGLSSIRYLRTLYYMIKVTFAILLAMLKTGRALEK